MAFFLNEFFISLEDISPSPGYLKGRRILKMLAPLYQEAFQELVFKEFNN